MAAELNEAENGNDDDDVKSEDRARTSARTRVFVYGTLKRGQPNHYLLEDGVHLGDCTIGDNYCMVRMGWFPGVVRGPNFEGTVAGEVYEVDQQTLCALDILEGHPNFFRRHKVATKFKNAWIYLVPTAYAEGDDAARIASGVWGSEGE